MSRAAFSRSLLISALWVHPANPGNRAAHKTIAIGKRLFITRFASSLGPARLVAVRGVRSAPEPILVRETLFIGKLLCLQIFDMAVHPTHGRAFGVKLSD